MLVKISYRFVEDTSYPNLEGLKVGIILSGDTYGIRRDLRAFGFKYSSKRGWYNTIFSWKYLSSFVLYLVRQGYSVEGYPPPDEFLSFLKKADEKVSHLRL